MNPLNYSNPDPKDQNAPPAEYLEIDTGSRRRWMGKLAYLAFFIFVAAMLFFIFIRFTASVGWAATLVVFMISYMLIMGHWAGKGLDRRD